MAILTRPLGTLDTRPDPTTVFGTWQLAPGNEGKTEEDFLAWLASAGGVAEPPSEVEVVTPDLTAFDERLTQTGEMLAAVSKLLAATGSEPVTSTYKVYTGSDVEQLKTNGIYQLTNGTALKNMGFPGGGAAGMLQVLAVGQLVYWLWVAPQRGIIATNVFTNGRWYGWNILNQINQQFNPEYHRDAVVMYGSSSMALLGGTTATKLTPMGDALKAAGVTCINKAESGTFVNTTLAHIGGNPFTVSFPEGVIKSAAASPVSIQFENPNGYFGTGGQFCLLDNGIKGTLRITKDEGGGKATGSFTATAATNPTELVVDPETEFRTWLYTFNGYQNGVVIVSTGKNDISNGRNADFVIPQFDKIVKCITPKLQPRFVVVGQFGNFNYRSEQVDEVRKLNEWQRKRYGRRYYDLEAYLCGEQIWTDAGLTPTSEDTAAQAAFKLAPSLSRDGGSHMSDKVNDLVAAELSKLCISLGYFGAPTTTWVSSNSPTI